MPQEFAHPSALGYPTTLESRALPFDAQHVFQILAGLIRQPNQQPLQPQNPNSQIIGSSDYEHWKKLLQGWQNEKPLQSLDGSGVLFR